MSKYIQFEVFQNCLKWVFYINTLFSPCSYRLDYKNTKRVDLPEVDFSFHEDNHKFKEMTEVTSRDHEASFIESYHPPRLMSRKIIKEVKGNVGGQGKPWAVISLTLWLSLWKEKSSSGKSTLVRDLSHRYYTVVAKLWYNINNKEIKETNNTEQTYMTCKGIPNCS